MNPYLTQPRTEKEYDEGKNANIQFCAAHMQGWRTTMEDSHIADINLGNDTSLFGVFDGHGGAEVALFVKENFVKELMKNGDFKKRVNLEQVLKDTFVQMDKIMITKEGIARLIQLKGIKTPFVDLNLIYAGCTANVALIYKNQLFVANSGDSRSVLCSRKISFPMSIDHKPDEASEFSRIKEAGGFVSYGRVNGNLNLSRAMGDFEYKGITCTPNNENVYCKFPGKAIVTVVPEVKTKVLIGTDRFLLMGCDGIWECKTNEELINYVNDQLDKKVQIKEILEKLLNAILAKDWMSENGTDNMTVILVLLGKQ